MLAMFMRNVIDMNSILEEAEEIYFLEKFDDALYEALVNPSDDFIKVVYNNMGGKRMTDKSIFQNKSFNKWNFFK